MSRTRRTWTVFAVCVAAVAVAFGWVAFALLRLERGEIEARADAQFQESLRLALWRLDSLLTPLFAQEAARPYSQYSPPQSSDQSSNRMANVSQAAGATGNSALLGPGSEFFRIHFQVGPDGVITSPEVPSAGLPNTTTSAQRIEDSGLEARETLAKLRRLVTRESLLRELARAQQGGPAELVIARRSTAFVQTPSERMAEDFNARQQVANIAQNTIQNPMWPPDGRGTDAAVRQSGFVPMWCAGVQAGGEELLFIRSVTAGRMRTVQGVWVDWPRLRRWLLDSIQDVLPGADLRPSLAGHAYPPGRMLASIPAVLEATPVAGASGDGLWRLTPTRVTLLVAFGAMLAAGIAVGLVLRAVIELGERRLQFASAVTHELRTPLTTFRMYSEMLASGMVADEAARGEYLTTLTREADRLTNVVENVLLYARVEQRRAATRREAIGVPDLIDRVSRRLAQRAAEVQMQLVIDTQAATHATVETDCQAVEQILFNLVDNSCKYAAGATDRRLHLDIRMGDGGVEMLYYDHGPGIPAAEERQVFEAFRRGSRDAAGSAPGVGLGLALARGLACELGGDLKLVKRPDTGAAFLLTLPLR